jgi:hypothetical protein
MCFLGSRAPRGGLAADYMHALLCEAALHAFAAENEARMEAMAAARNQIERKLSTLQAPRRLIRQEEITAEVPDKLAASNAAFYSKSDAAVRTLITVLGRYQATCTKKTNGHRYLDVGGVSFPARPVSIHLGASHFQFPISGKSRP